MFTFFAARNLWAAMVAGVALAASGCGQGKVQVYDVPKEDHSGHDHAANQPDPHAASPHGGPAQAAKAEWKVPEGWQEGKTTAMRVGSFIVSNPEGKRAEVSVIPLPGGKEIEVMSVNMWRGELGLQPLTKEADLSGQGEALEVGGSPGRLFDLANEAATNEAPVKTVAAVVQRPDATWFFKMTGDATLVNSQKENFKSFLKSVAFKAAEAGTAAAAAPSAGQPPMAAPGMGMGMGMGAGGVQMGTPGKKPSWEVPAQWKEQSSGSMRIGSFLVTNASGAKADVSVTMLGGDGGGPLANVNRWRGQLQLAPIGEAELTKSAATLEVGSDKATLIDIVSPDQKTRMLAAMILRPGESWFFKMTGDGGLVAEQRPAFENFVKSVRFQ